MSEVVFPVPVAVELKPVPERIAFCITELDDGGAERALWQIVRRLDHDVWDPFVICLSGNGPLVAKFQQLGIPVHCLGLTKWNVPLVLWRLRRLLSREQPRLLQTWLYHASILGRIAGRWAKVPVIVAGIRVAERRSRWRLWLDRTTARWVTRHVCVSEGVAEFTADVGGIPRDRLLVIPNGVDAARFRDARLASLAEFGWDEHANVVLFVGRLDEQKDPQLLIGAFGELAETHPEARLLLVGDGPLRSSLQGMVAERELTSRVHFAGRRDDVPSLMRAAGVLALSSRWEGMPNVVLEALVAGLRVVSTHVEGLDELVSRGLPVQIVGVGDRAEFAKALKLASGSPAISPEEAHASQAMISKEFTWDVVAATYAKLYQELLMN